ncbi:MAG: hypothetical protein ACKPKO_19035, partial [Candidatus Fonsibacter sp.]
HTCLTAFASKRITHKSCENTPTGLGSQQKKLQPCTISAKEALQQLWMLFEVHQAAEAEAFGKVALVAATTDVALKNIWQGRITQLTGDAAYATEEGHCPHPGHNSKVPHRDLRRFGKP